MPIKIEVKITEKDIFSFMLHHHYSRPSGIFGTIMGAFALLVGINYIVQGNIQSSLILIICGFLLVAYIPYVLKKKAKAQKNAEMFQHPLEYEFSDRGISVKQGDQEVTNEWDTIEKAVSTRKCIIIYMSRIRAIIFPKRCLGDKYGEIVEMIYTHMPTKKVKIRHVH